VISAEAFAACAELDESNRIVTVPAFAVDVNPDRTWGAIGVGGFREDGRPQVAVVDHERGTDWIVDRCVELKGEHRRARFVVDKRGPAAALIDDLKAAGVKRGRGGRDGLRSGVRLVLRRRRPGPAPVPVAAARARGGARRRAEGAARGRVEVVAEELDERRHLAARCGDARAVGREREGGEVRVIDLNAALAAAES
jgi:hypothetical protein